MVPVKKKNHAAQQSQRNPLSRLLDLAVKMLIVVGVQQGWKLFGDFLDGIPFTMAYSIKVRLDAYKS